jgi:prepilin signal peptidase PulO-like enzyme (type II secretory pathway)
MLTITILAAVIGLLVGSFLNNVILRTHEGKTFVKGRSSCPNCGHVLSPLELVPVLSWLGLRGRCCQCKEPISWQYPTVELLTAALFVWAYITHTPDTLGNLAVLLLWGWVISGLVVLSVYDLRWYLLPDKVLLPLIIPAGLILIIESLQAHSWRVAAGPLFAALLFGGIFYLLAVVTKGKGMGGGDIKLAFVMGLLLGIQKTSLAMFLAFVVAAVVGAILIVLRLKSRRSHIPFGPFLIGGTLIAYLAGSPILHWYLDVSSLNLLS